MRDHVCKLGLDNLKKTYIYIILMFLYLLFDFITHVHTRAHKPEVDALFGESAIFWLEESMRFHVLCRGAKSGVVT